MELTAIERDAIIELFNLAMGQAAAALSQMVGEEVVLSVPSLALLNRGGAVRYLGCPKDQRICAVKEGFSGPFEGQAVLIFPEQCSLELVRRLLTDSPPVTSMTELEEEALTEIGNVILNYCLSSFANLLNTEIRTDLPVYQTGLPDEVIGIGLAPNSDHVLVIRVDFGLASQSIQGYVLFMQDIVSIQTFRDAIRSFLVSNGF